MSSKETTSTNRTIGDKEYEGTDLETDSIDIREVLAKCGTEHSLTLFIVISSRIKSISELSTAN
jgi:hypothetical protein